MISTREKDNKKEYCNTGKEPSIPVIRPVFSPPEKMQRRTCTLRDETILYMNYFIVYQPTRVLGGLADYMKQEPSQFPSTKPLLRGAPAIDNHILTHTSTGHHQLPDAAPHASAAPAAFESGVSVLSVSGARVCAPLPLGGQPARRPAARARRVCQGRRLLACSCQLSKRACDLFMGIKKSHARTKRKGARAGERAGPAVCDGRPQGWVGGARQPWTRALVRVRGSTTPAPNMAWGDPRVQPLPRPNQRTRRRPCPARTCWP